MLSSHQPTDIQATISGITTLGQKRAWQQALGRLCQAEGHPCAIAAWTSCITACKGGGRWQIALGLHAAMMRSGLEASVVSYGSTVSALAADAQWVWVLRALEDMASCQLQPNVVVLNSAIRSCQEWAVAIALLADLQQSLRADAISFNAAIAASADNWEVAVAILQQMQEASVLQDVVTYTGIIKACGRRIQWQAALEVLDHMQGKGVERDLHCLNCVLNACEGGDRWDASLQLLHDMILMQLRPDDTTCGTAISACGKAGRWQHALALFADMPHHSARRSVFSHTAAVSACAKVGRWDLALSIMARMQETSTTPNSVTMGAVITAFANSASWDRALSMLAECRRGLPPVALSVVCFNAAILACHHAGQWQYAIHVLGDIEPDAMPDIASQNTAMKACGSQSQWQRVIAMLEDCTRKALQSNELTYQAVLVACSTAAQWEQCVSALAGPNDFGIVSHTIAIDALRNEGGWAMALVLLEMAECRGLRLDTISCNAAMNACAGSGHWAAGLALLARMQASRIRQSVATHTSALTATAVAACWEVALMLLTEFRSGSDASTAVYNAALSAMENIGCWEHALTVLNAMESEGVQLDVLTCSSAMSACEKGMRWEHALAVLSLLVQRTLQPDAVSFNAAIEACSGAGQWPIVGELMRSALQSSGGFAIAAYDHSVQAGSSVDCFKHLVLILLLQHMVRDGSPFAFIDTHAGRGVYDLTAEVPMLKHTSKWGVQRLGEHLSSSDGVLDAFHRTQRGFQGNEGALRQYLGSPAIALHWLRPQDHGLFFELSEPTFADLERGLRGLDTSGVELRCANSYAWILDNLSDALLPPRRLIFTDPPYEPYDVSMACNLLLLEQAHEACCVVWYPLLDGVDPAPFYRRAAELTKGDALVVEFGFETSESTSLQSSGILVAHPPHGKRLPMATDAADSRTVELNDMAEGTEVQRQSSDAEAVCWICRDPDRAEPLVAPCRCRGSMRGVHASCIESWVAARTQQRMRSEMQGGDSAQPRICCDLCGEPYQAEHQPANFCECVKAHCRGCIEELRTESGLSARQVLLAIPLGAWMLFVLLAISELVAGVLLQACRRSSCWVAVSVTAVCLATLLFEMVIVLASFPCSGTPPSCTALRPFHIPATDPNSQAVVLLLWLHLWMAPLISALCGCLIRIASIGPKVAPVAWWLVGILAVPPLIPLVKHTCVTLRGCSWQQMASTCSASAQAVRHRCRECCSSRSLRLVCGLLRLISSPSLPWVHICLAVPFGIAWFCSAPPSARYWVLGTTGGLGCAAAAFAWLQLCFKGPLHDDYLCPYEASVRMHAGWLLAFVMLLYAAFSVLAEWHFLQRSKRDPVRANVAIFVVWCVWVSLVAGLAAYANCYMLLGYSQTWRRRNGRVRIGGEAVRV
ncbi:unnamed protein product [Symbiodinium natans]|uniref:RING-CH-type domain-containing protein n=1 Tax=Symbiodinium natans TaxID=878477 RepID=A0A812JAF4_9DINO|nr:unnamed protein product [Symbiodinium natans]